ncbi:hypothetical protein G570DRAFT_0008 [Sphingomonas jaspsi DSM 18422]|uniref:Lipoprotein n=1 Tax=Sphingomonas jaspsi DSM 18422 TaxID=1123268 RepID=A0A011AM36_9SPHN|nr:hypothetical protein G570DRAFT_0008 [Sphingomonas jaspsi DSM 18422]
MISHLKSVLAAGPLLAIIACSGSPETTGNSALNSDNSATPAGLPLFGDGYPSKGDPCRRVGESAATVDFLDDSADLVGCPSAKDAGALSGKVVATIGETILVSVPRKSAPLAASEDALVPGTDFNATAEIECAGYRRAAEGRCPAGVKRNREDGVTTVEVNWPKGGSRAIFFKDGKLLGADTNEADGSARFEVKGERKADVTTVTIGPERYVIPDAFVTGG